MIRTDVTCVWCGATGVKFRRAGFQWVCLACENKPVPNEGGE